MMKNIEYNYRPIDPKSPIEIKASKIDGLGLFAKANISAGTYLGTTHILVDGDLIRTPMGGFINCSKTPNAKLFQLPKVKRSNYYGINTIRDIADGEEITIDYNQGMSLILGEEVNLLNLKC